MLRDPFGQWGCCCVCCSDQSERHVSDGMDCPWCWEVSSASCSHTSTVVWCSTPWTKPAFQFVHSAGISCLHPAAPAHIENHTCHQSDKHRLILKVLSFFNRYRRLWSLLKTTSVLFDQSSFLSMCALSYLYFSTTSASVPLTLTGERGGTLLSDRANKSLS